MYFGWVGLDTKEQLITFGTDPDGIQIFHNSDIGHF